MGRRRKYMRANTQMALPSPSLDSTGVNESTSASYGVQLIRWICRDSIGIGGGHGCTVNRPVGADPGWELTVTVRLTGDGSLN